MTGKGNAEGNVSVLLNQGHLMYFSSLILLILIKTIDFPSLYIYLFLEMPLKDHMTCH
jgi:hypothetical protein